VNVEYRNNEGVMMWFFKYLSYVIRHKWFVFVECAKVGIPMRGLMHDMSKLRPSEFFPYARFFYDEKGKQKQVRDKTGYYKPTDTGDDAFDFAWLLHQKRNRHHWQWWILPEDNGGTKVLPMPYHILREMICDWKGAGRAQGLDDDVRPWYLKNKDKMTLHPDSRTIIEPLIEPLKE